MTVTVRELVVAALLRGDEIIAPEFARTAGCTPGGVTDVMGKLAILGLVKARKEKRANFYIKIWTAADREGLAGYQPRPPGQHVRTKADMAPLLEAWGMPLKAPKLKLPSLRHVCYDEPEGVTA